ncbi:unnamed protein product, partial [marine sediment metagenome]
LIFLVGIALGSLLSNAWSFAKIITLPNDLDKKVDKYIDELVMLSVLQKFIKSKLT